MERISRTRLHVSVRQGPLAVRSAHCRPLLASPKCRPFGGDEAVATLWPCGRRLGCDRMRLLAKAPGERHSVCEAR